MRVRSLSMFVRGLAMLAGGRGVVLRLIVLAARMMMLSLMVVMRCSVVVTSGGVMMLGRRMFCHFSVLPCSDLGRTISIVRHSPKEPRNCRSGSRNSSVLAMGAPTGVADRETFDADGLLSRQSSA
jgi:hypothetical protein